MSEACCGMCTECQRKCAEISGDAYLESRVAWLEGMCERAIWFSRVLANDGKDYTAQDARQWLSDLEAGPEGKDV